MSENRGGDVLARGERSAQFRAAGAGLSEFEYDLTTNTESVSQKYGLSLAEVESYVERRGNGERFDLKPVLDKEDNSDGRTALEQRWADMKPVEKNKLKFADKIYSDPVTILDRILVKRVPDDPDKFDILADGSLRDKKTGFVIPYAYRQHNNIGIVLSTGQFVMLGGIRVPMSEVVRVGDRVTFGDYNSEVFKMSVEKTQKLCDAVQMNYEEDPEGLRVIRVQDIRIVERPEIDKATGHVESVEDRSNWDGV